MTDKTLGSAELPNDPCLWERRDRWPLLGPLGAGLLLIGATLAVVGLPPVDVHGPLHYAGIMDPLCGGTRGVRLALRGDLAGAWHYNPASIPVVLAAMAAVVRHIYGYTTGRWLALRTVPKQLILVASAALLLLLEINQQRHADLLRSRETAEAVSALAFYAATRLLVATAAVAWILRRRRRGVSP